MRTVLTAIALVALLVGAGCGEDSAEDERPEGHQGTATTSSPSTTTSATASPVGPESQTPTDKPDEGQVIEITFKGDTVSPNGDRVEVSLEEPIILRITADAPGELHVHSSPEQELAYKSGISDVTL